MPAPKGNQYWDFVGKHGRNHKYTPEKLWAEAEAYFTWMSERVWNKKEAIKSGEMAGTLIDIPTMTPMSIKTFCLYADIDHKTFLNYESAKGYEDFFQVTRKIRYIIESQQLEGATVGAYNANIVARLLGLADKQEHEIKGGLNDLKLPKFMEKGKK